MRNWSNIRPTAFLGSTLRDSIRNSYRSHYRQIVPSLLKALEFRSNNEMRQPVILALELVRRYADTKLRHFPLDEDVPLDFVEPLWRDDVVEEDGKGRPRVNHITYEIATFNALRDQCVARRFESLAPIATGTPTTKSPPTLRHSAMPTMRRSS